jgi:hypothetical protein
MFKRLKTRRGKYIAVTGIGTLLAGAAAGVAFAAGPNYLALAPHAQASAVVNFDGTIYTSQGVKQVTKPSTGVYCLTFDDSRRIAVARSTPSATLFASEGSSPAGYNVLLNTTPTKACGQAADTLTVFTFSPQGAVDYPFSVVVP